ncbi:MAG: N-acetyl-gamma-glutamyl-phosphate reductase [Alphaproteobacteria bacterium]|nr:N-acetyl-gamma-glutamyl-phosphate reductase [Alphaproteobacteria bacterium]
MGERLRKASIVGITGYTGLELLRLLQAHPHVQIAHVTSRQNEGEALGVLYPHLAHLDLKITNPSYEQLAKDSDIVFLALPHKTAQDAVAALHGKVKVIDLSADYRLDDVKTYEKYYCAHNHPELLKEIVYGLPEINREAIKGAQSVANPGCFALLSQLMLFPYAGHLEAVDIMAVTGSSGAGKSPVEGTHHPVRSHNMKSYNINKHRHIPEILRTAQLPEDRLNFVPTSGPFTRGIFATAFVRTKTMPTKCSTEIYKDSSFVRIMKEVSLANVVGSNFCDIAYTMVEENNFIAQGAIDNLVKGAAGCAVQNMNLMCGWDETTGLDILSPVYP